MPTAFALLLQVCGLSHGEAARFLNVRPDTVKSWATGRRSVPGDALTALADLAAKIDAAADAAMGQVAEVATRAWTDPTVIELGIAADDHEAQSLGWPCVGAHRAVLALTLARGMAEGHRFAIVPRGLTLATAAAADARERP